MKELLKKMKKKADRMPSQDSYIRKMEMAEKSKDFQILKLLAMDANWHVREAVARNRNTPESILLKLASSENPLLRETVASNPNTPESILLKLASDSDGDVLVAVSENPKASSVAIIFTLFYRDTINEKTVENGVLKNG